VVFEFEHQRATHGAAVPQTTGHFDGVLLDALPASSAKTVLPSLQPLVDEAAVELETRRQTLEDSGQPWAVGLPSGEKTKPPHAGPPLNTTSNETMVQLYAVLVSTPRKTGF